MDMCGYVCANTCIMHAKDNFHMWFCMRAFIGDIVNVMNHSHKMKTKSRK